MIGVGSTLHFQRQKRSFIERIREIKKKIIKPHG